MATQITAQDIELVDSIRLDLLGCTSKNEIDDVFFKAGIDDFALMTQFLYTAMQIQKVYGIPADTVPSDKEVYEYYVSFYLEGLWKEFAY